MQSVVGCVVIGVGVLLIKYRKDFVDDITKTNNAGFGFHKYGKKEEQLNLKFAIAFGALAIVVGCLILLNIFRLK